MYDKTIRNLFYEVPSSLIKLLTNKNAKKILNSHFPIQEREADLIVELEDESIFHLEIQSINDKNMPKRMLFYYVLIENIYKKFPTQAVLYVGDNKLTMKNFIKNESINFKFNIIYIKMIDCNVLIKSENIQDNILAILCKIDDFNLFFDKILKKLIKLDPKKREDYLKRLILLARLRPKIVANIKQIIKENKLPIVIDKKNDPFYIDGWNEAWNEAWSEAWSKAQQEAKISDALVMIKEFNLPLEKVALKLNIDKNILIEKLKENNAS